MGVAAGIASGDLSNVAAYGAAAAGVGLKVGDGVSNVASNITTGAPNVARGIRSQFEQRAFTKQQREVLENQRSDKEWRKSREVQQMYKDEYYQLIFGADAKEGIIADLLKISYYYDCFLKTEIQNRGYDEKTVLPMLKNGKTFQLAAIGFLCKVYNKVFTYDIIEILTGADNMMPGMEPNRGAATKIEEYLEMQAMKNLPTSMADVQSRYSAIPYGWKEIDIAAVAIVRNVGQKTPYSG